MSERTKVIIYRAWLASVVLGIAFLIGVLDKYGGTAINGVNVFAIITLYFSISYFFIRRLRKG